eukprot:TRINITY_DN309_c0_g1_i34.p1 TRINITY_DN309_c0_g1~~TRINITY_DN309_c0_g1_i34.p1  ORF type:complete len:337 (+),score=118.81 TRINITY_DN309_c0_g1_i34:289-1299(+)
MAEELKAKGMTSDLENLLNDGPLERYEMEHLIDTHPMIAKLKKRNPDSYLGFTRIFFSFGTSTRNLDHFQMPEPQEMIGVQDAFDHFLASPKDGALVITAGVITHWVVIVVHREKGLIKEYLLDSLAHQYLHIPEEFIPANVQLFYEQKCAAKRKKVVPYRVKMFTQLLTDLRKLYTIVHKVVMGEMNLKQLHVNSEVRIIWEEYEPVLNSCAKTLELEYAKDKEIESLTLLRDKLAEVPGEKKQDIAKELYTWLLGHKPKFLRDGIMFELKIVGAKHMSKNLKTMMNLWCDIQELILDKTGIPLLSEPVDEDNSPKKVLEDYRAFLTDFRAVLSA